MELISAKSVFETAKAHLEGRDQDGRPVPVDLDKSERLLNEILNNNPGNAQVLYVLGTLHMVRGNFGLAIQMLRQIVDHHPEFGEAWNNLAMSYRGIDQWDDAAEACQKAVQFLNTPDISTNLAGLYLNRGIPEKALPWCDKALSLMPGYARARWHKAVALLEMGRYDEAWDLHESRLEGGANENIAERNYHGPERMTPWWDGKTAEKVAIHGEEGMGDEIMFASCLPDAIKTGAEIIVEPSPRLEGLFKRSFPDAFVFGTDRTDGKGWIERRGRPDSKCPLGTLPRFYRRSVEAFPGTPYMVASPEKMEFWGRKLAALGDRPRVGIAWQGGVPSTRVSARSIHPSSFRPLFEHDCTWVSLQYDSTARLCVDQVLDQLQVEIAHWPKAVEAKDPETGKPSDLDELAALIACLDLVITVPQTCYHVSGALGIPTWVLTQSEPDWRLGVSGDTVPWYGSVSLIRQTTARQWDEPIRTAAEWLGRFIERGRKTA